MLYAHTLSPFHFELETKKNIVNRSMPFINVEDLFKPKCKLGYQIVRFNLNNSIDFTVPLAITIGQHINIDFR